MHCYAVCSYNMLIRHFKRFHFFLCVISSLHIAQKTNCFSFLSHSLVIYWLSTCESTLQLKSIVTFVMQETLKDGSSLFSFAQLAMDQWECTIAKKKLEIFSSANCNSNTKRTKSDVLKRSHVYFLFIGAVFCMFMIWIIYRLMNITWINFAFMRCPKGVMYTLQHDIFSCNFLCVELRLRVKTNNANKTKHKKSDEILWNWLRVISSQIEKCICKVFV